MGLSHWEIKFLRKESKGNFAECFPQPKYCFASINFSECFFEDMEQSEQEQGIIHELLHCHFNFWTEIFNETFIDTPDHAKNPMMVIRNLIKQREETSVELLARGIHKAIQWQKFQCIQHGQKSDF